MFLDVYIEMRHRKGSNRMMNTIFKMILRQQQADGQVVDSDQVAGFGLLPKPAFVGGDSLPILITLFKVVIDVTNKIRKGT